MTVIEQIAWIAQGQLTSQGTAPTAPSPEVLKALTDLMNAVRGHSSATDPASWWSPAGLTAVAAFIASVTWPVLALVVIAKFSPQLVGLLSRMTKVEWLGIKAEIQTELNKAAAEAAPLAGLSKGASTDELQRAVKVAEIAGQGDIALVRQQVDTLAIEYENIRAAMPPGDPRTRRMEVVVSKMRTIGRAAFPIRYELIQSPSPGRRLQAIASLQVLPDFDLLDWLADRIRVEKPFIGYHAVVALNAAVRDPHARRHLNNLEAALKSAKEGSQGLPRDSDRMQALSEFENATAALRAST
jgi:hypothetical protein